MIRFPVFDHERTLSVEYLDGVPTIVNDRYVVEEHCVLEPLDERTDFFASIPIRSVITAGCGPAVEIGPFSLTSKDVVTLYNALSAHINNFPGEFKRRAS